MDDPTNGIWVASCVFSFPHPEDVTCPFSFSYRCVRLGLRCAGGEKCPWRKLAANQPTAHGNVIGQGECYRTCLRNKNEQSPEQTDHRIPTLMRQESRLHSGPPFRPIEWSNSLPEHHHDHRPHFLPPPRDNLHPSSRLLAGPHDRLPHRRRPLSYAMVQGRRRPNNNLLPSRLRLLRNIPCILSGRVSSGIHKRVRKLRHAR